MEPYSIQLINIDSPPTAIDSHSILFPRLQWTHIYGCPLNITDDGSRVCIQFEPEDHLRNLTYRML